MEPFNAECKKNQFEIYFEWYLEDLKSHGFIKSFKFQPFSIDIFDELKIDYIKNKRKGKHSLLGKLSYTPDYEIVFTKKARGVFFDSINNDSNNLFYFYNTDSKSNKCLVDVKSADYRLGQDSSTVKFPVIQKTLFYVKDIFVNRVISFKKNSTHKNYLFPNTFTPSRFLLTDKKKGNRIIHFPVKSIEDFIKSIQ